MFYNPMQLPGKDEQSACGGTYEHDMVRTPEGWKSEKVVENNMWFVNPPAVRQPSARRLERPTRHESRMRARAGWLASAALVCAALALTSCAQLDARGQRRPAAGATLVGQGPVGVARLD